MYIQFLCLASFTQHNLEVYLYCCKQQSFIPFIADRCPIPLYEDTVNEYLELFNLLAFMTKTTMNTHVQVFVFWVFF